MNNVNEIPMRFQHRVKRLKNAGMLQPVVAKSHNINIGFNDGVSHLIKDGLKLGICSRAVSAPGLGLSLLVVC